MACCSEPYIFGLSENVSYNGKHSIGSFPMCTSNQILYPSATNDTPEVSLGPVIGIVTHNSARILVEVDNPVKLVCTLKPMHSVPEQIEIFTSQPNEIVEQSAGGEVIAVEEGRRLPKNPRRTKRLEARTPHVFRFTNLIPYTRYCVTFNIAVNGLINSQFRTLPSPDVRFERCPLNVAVVGANETEWDHFPVGLSNNEYRTFETVDRDALKYTWKSLYERAAKHQLSYVVHLGDTVSTLLARSIRAPDPAALSLQTVQRLAEVDIDTTLPPSLRTSAWKAAITIAETHPSQEARMFIMELFKQLYRNSWSEPYTRHALANVPNVILMNEFDIGKFTTEATHPNEDLVASCAFEVFNQYSRSLFTRYRPGLPPISFREQCHDQGGHFLSLGSLGICAPNLRSAQTFFAHRLKDDQPLMGRPEWRTFARSLKSDGKFKDTNLLLVCLQQPIGTGSSMWTRNLFAMRTRAKFLRALLVWRDAMPVGYRELLIVAPAAQQETHLTDIIVRKFHSKICDKMAAAAALLETRVAYHPETLSACPTEDEIACGRWVTSPVAFFPRNRIRQFLIPPMAKKRYRAIKRDKQYSSGVSQISQDTDILVVHYAKLKGSGYGVITGDSDYVFKDDILFKNVRSAQKSGYAQKHTDLVRFWTRLYMQASDGSILGQKAVKSTEWKSVTTDLCCQTSQVFDIDRQ